jgi:hypothetical protein
MNKNIMKIPLDLIGKLALCLRRLDKDPSRSEFSRRPTVACVRCPERDTGPSASLCRAHTGSSFHRNDKSGEEPENQKERDMKTAKKLRRKVRLNELSLTIIKEGRLPGESRDETIQRLVGAALTARKGGGL